MKIKRKGIFLFASIGMVAITATLIASCAKNTTPKKSELKVQVLEQKLKPLNNQKYGLKLKVDTIYANHFVQVDMEKSVTNTNQNSISSAKNKVSSNGEVIVEFSNLDLESKYLIKRIKVFKQINDQKPLINEEYTTKNLLNVHKTISPSKPEQTINPDQKNDSKLLSINKVFHDGIVYKKLNDSLEYKKSVDDEFNNKEMDLEVIDLDNNESKHFSATAKDNLVTFDLSQLNFGNYQVKQLQNNEENKQVSINQIKFTHSSKLTKPFAINSSGQTNLEIENPNIKKNEYFYAIFKDDSNNNEEYKVLSQAKENNKLNFNVGVLTNKSYILDRLESNEIDTLEKKRRVVLNNDQLDQKYKDSFKLEDAKAEVVNKKLELTTNNETINHFLSFSLPYEATNNKILQKVLVAKFKDDLGSFLELQGSYEKDKFIFDTSKLSTNKLWTLTDFYIKEKELTNPVEKTIINKLELKTTKPVYVINNDINSTNLAIQSKLKTVDINTNEDKSKTVKFYNTKLVGQTVKLFLGNESDDKLVELSANVNDGLIATFDVSKENNLKDDVKYIIKKITNSSGVEIANVDNLSNVEKYLYKNKFLVDVKKVIHPLKDKDYRDAQLEISNLNEIITSEDRKYLNFVFEYYGKAIPFLESNNKLTTRNLKDAKKHEKVEKSASLIKPEDTGNPVINLKIPHNRHYQLKRIEIKRLNKTILLYKNDSSSFNITNGYGIKNIFINPQKELQVELIADNPNKHINTSFTIYFKTSDGKVEKYEGKISPNLNAIGEILQHKIPLNYLGFDLNNSKVIAISLNDETHEKYNILDNKEFQLKSQ